MSTQGELTYIGEGGSLALLPLLKTPYYGKGKQFFLGRWVPSPCSPYCEKHNSPCRHKDSEGSESVRMYKRSFYTAAHT